MIITVYLLKSVLAMSVLLAIYKLFLEKEKMHQFNRLYLIVAILLSLAVPFLPTGLSIDRVDPTELVQLLTVENIEVVESSGSEINQNYGGLDNVISILYLIVFIFLGIKFSRNIFQLIYFIVKHKKRVYKEAKIILLDKRVTPFTFMDYIFLNKKDFEGQNIDMQLMDHELAHVKQRHSLDVLFIEFIITVFWFNPILRWYKTAIQLNHEFLADEAVINKYQSVKTYQYLLLDTIQNNNKISLASNINFHLTQKRLEMMTKKSSSKKKNVLILSTIPLIFAVLLLFGNPVISQNTDKANSKEIQNNTSIDKDKYFEHAIIHFMTNNGKTKVVKYASLNKDTKDKIPPPPAHSDKDLKPLPKGTIVYVSEDGRVVLSNEKRGQIPPPPPPVASVKVPKAPKEPKALKANKVPKPPKAVKPPKPPKPVKAPKPPKPPKEMKAVKAVNIPGNPPPPPPPPTLEELLKEGATFYINGKLASVKQAKELIRNIDNVESIKIFEENGGKNNVYVVNKKSE